MITDPISDMLTRIRNASTVKKSVVDIPLSKVKFAIAKILEAEQFVARVETIEVLKRPVIRVHLKYGDNKRPRIASIRRVSTPGRRIYVKSDRISTVRSGLGMAILSTSNGLMTNLEARKRHLGGEVICELY
jgi:small subunit ribosomal protein S8